MNLWEKVAAGVASLLIALPSTALVQSAARAQPDCSQQLGDLQENLRLFDREARQLGSGFLRGDALDASLEASKQGLGGDPKDKLMRWSQRLKQWRTGIIEYKDCVNRPSCSIGDLMKRHETASKNVADWLRTIGDEGLATANDKVNKAARLLEDYGSQAGSPAGGVLGPALGCLAADGARQIPVSEKDLSAREVIAVCQQRGRLLDERQPLLAERDGLKDSLSDFGFRFAKAAASHEQMTAAHEQAQRDRNGREFVDVTLDSSKAALEQFLKNLPVNDVLSPRDAERLLRMAGHLRDNFKPLSNALEKLAKSTGPANPVFYKEALGLGGQILDFYEIAQADSRGEQAWKGVLMAASEVNPAFGVILKQAGTLAELQFKEYQVEKATKATEEDLKRLRDTTDRMAVVGKRLGEINRTLVSLPACDSTRLVRGDAEAPAAPAREDEGKTTKKKKGTPTGVKVGSIVLLAGGAAALAVGLGELQAAKELSNSTSSGGSSTGSGGGGGMTYVSSGGIVCNYNSGGIISSCNAQVTVNITRAITVGSNLRLMGSFWGGNRTTTASPPGSTTFSLTGGVGGPNCPGPLTSLNLLNLSQSTSVIIASAGGFSIPVTCR